MCHGLRLSGPSSVLISVPPYSVLVISDIHGSLDSGTDMGSLNGSNEFWFHRCWGYATPLWAFQALWETCDSRHLQLATPECSSVVWESAGVHHEVMGSRHLGEPFAHGPTFREGPKFEISALSPNGTETQTEWRKHLHHKLHTAKSPLWINVFKFLLCSCE